MSAKCANPQNTYCITAWSVYSRNGLLQACSHPCRIIFLSHSFRLKQQNQSHINRSRDYKCLYYTVHMQAYNRDAFKLHPYGFSKRRITERWAEASCKFTVGLKYKPFEEASVVCASKCKPHLLCYIYFSVPRASSKGTNTPCPEDLSSSPIAKQHLFQKAFNTCVHSHGCILWRGGGPGAINSLFLTQLQLLLWRIDVRNSNWRLESGSGQFSPSWDENSTGSERLVKYIPWMHLEVRDHTKYAGQRPLVLSLKSSCEFRHG